MGIILFNQRSFPSVMWKKVKSRFRPLMGIILFNEVLSMELLKFLNIGGFPSPNGDYFI